METNQQRLAVIEELDKRISRWGQPRISPTWHHPFDDPKPEYGEFIEREIASREFHPWQTFQVVVGRSEHGPMLETSVERYYHYWQIFLLAEALTMGVSVFVNFGDEELWKKSYSGEVGEIARERKWMKLNVHGWHGIKGIRQHIAAFEALAYFLAYRQFALADAVEGKVVNERFRLIGEPLRVFRKREEEIAREAVARWDVENSALLSFIKWQCERWAEWDSRDRKAVANEYKKNIRETVDLYRILTGREYDEVENEVGRVTNHFAPTLRVIFPDWIKNQKESAERSLKQWIGPTMSPLAPLGYDISDIECEGFLEWIRQEGQLQFLWHFRRLVDLGEREDPVGLAGIASEVSNLCLTIEHIVNYIGFRHTSLPHGTLHDKTKWLWGLNQDVVRGLQLGKSRGLTSVNANTLEMALLDIDRTPDTDMGGQFSPIVRALLKTILIRNQGAHFSFARFSREEIYQLLETLLRGSLLIWKQVKMMQLV